VLRRLVECLGRDRTRHQVAEVTSLGLVQMTRKRIGTGLLESFSHDCPHCHGRGVVVEDAPVEAKKVEDEPRRGKRSRGRGKQDSAATEPPKAPSPKDIAAMARHHDELHDDADDHTDGSADGDTDAPDVDETIVESEALAEDPADALAATTEETLPEPAEESAPQPQDAVPAEPEPAPPVEPEKPRVVTRTRRRSASRPAGPPASVDGTSGSGAGDATEAPADKHADEVPALHVPVKKKGARKR
jgi:ribonuclease E